MHYTSRFTHLVIAIIFPVIAAAASVPVPSGVAKVFVGPEGEALTLLEVNESKEMLVRFKGVGGELEGKTKLYLFRTANLSTREVYYTQKRGSKMRELILLSSSRPGQWLFWNPGNNAQLNLTFSAELTEKTKIEDLLNTYKP